MTETTDNSGFSLDALSDPKAFSSMSPLTSIVVYVCIALAVVLVILLILWIVSACCERESYRKSQRDQCAGLGLLVSPTSASDAGYGSTPCLSTITTTSFGNDTDARLLGKKYFCRSSSPRSDAFPVNGADSHCSDCNVVVCSALCSKCDKALKLPKKRPKRHKSSVKRRYSERAKLLRNSSLLYHVPSSFYDRQAYRSQSQHGHGSLYRQKTLPRSGQDFSEITVTDLSALRSKIPRAHLENDALIEKCKNAQQAQANSTAAGGKASESGEKPGNGSDDLPSTKNQSPSHSYPPPPAHLLGDTGNSLTSLP